MTVGEWLVMTKADAEKRGLPDLSAALDGLAQATERLRAADWNDNADRDTPVDLGSDSSRSESHLEGGGFSPRHGK